MYKPSASQTWLLLCLPLSLAALLPMHAQAGNFDARVLIQVQSSEGRPIEGATIQGRWQVQDEDPPFGVREEGFEGQTDERGRMSLNIRSRGFLRYAVFHPEYYGARTDMAFRERNLRRLEVLQPRTDPAPMVALRDLYIPIPVAQAELGFDLVRMDWMPPHGQGLHEDVRIAGGSRIRRVGTFTDYQILIRMTFTGEGNGIQAFSIQASDRGSRPLFDADYEAPEDGYQDTYSFEDSSGFDRTAVDPSTGAYYFRIRSQRDEEGQLFALHGRLYGIVSAMGSQREAALRFDRFYLQPNPRSRNIEFDPDENLAPGYVAERWHQPRHLNVRQP